ncbi:MAG TPA: PBP1A family penicillin-binding protein [Candidatus Paceibacterota bacterium]
MRHLTPKFFVYIILIFGFVGTGVLSLWLSTLTIPDLGSFETRKVVQSTKIYDRTGEFLLYDVHENVRRTVISIDDMSRNIKNATIAIEDAEFYQHIGIRPLAFLRAVLVNLKEGELSQGGSTITQQVVKNTLLTSDKQISRKLKEWVLALKLEKKLTKDEILEIYLNESPYGGSLYGIEEASQAFLGKSAANLTIAESAYLAALPQAPTYYSPYGNHIKELEDRKNLVLKRMRENNFINEEEYDSAKNEEVVFASRPETGIKAPHFVFYVLDQIEEKYGRRAIEEDGLRITTTLDWALEQKGEAIVKEYALSNAERFNAENAGLVAIDPKTGHILTMVGSRDYFDETIDGNYNLAVAKRQPGSAFKPFVYATAFKEGYTPDTVVFDTETQFSTTCSPQNFTSENGCYSPGNYDDIFRGPVTLRNALAQSINVPAVKVLYLVGIPDSLRTARDMGIETLTDPGRYGLTLVLGGGEVTLLDITSAYSVFANDGLRNPHTAILKIENAHGDVLYEFKPQMAQVVPQNVAREVSDILSDNVARTPLYGSQSLLYFGGRDVAVKTGTTNDYRDAWTVGYTPAIAVGAWAGNNDNRSMEKKISGLIITPLWRAFMDEALKEFNTEPFVPPLPADPTTLKPILRGVIENGADETIHSILYWLNKDDPNGPPPQNPESDPQFSLWEYGVSLWNMSHPLPAVATTSTAL